MSDRFKYSHNGICKIQNVPQTIDTDNGPTNWLFEINGFWCGIYLVQSVKYKSLLSAAIITRSDLPESTKTLPKTPVFLNILSENPKFQNKFKVETFAKGAKPVAGPEILISEVLNSKNGFLDENGAMTIEYGFHFDGIFDEHQEVWKFNLKCKTFDGESEKNMIIYKGKEVLYSHKQLILFHDSHTKISNEKNMIDILVVPDTKEINSFENFLQIAHGVQFELDVQELLDIVYIAHEYKIQNVLKYCERQLLMTISEFSEEDFRIFFPKKSQLGAISKLIMDAAKFDLNHFLAFLLKYSFENWEIKNPFFKRFNLEEMTNESMKMIVAKVLYGKY